MIPVNGGNGLIVVILGLILGSGAFGIFVSKVMPQRVSKDDKVSRLEKRLDDQARDHAAQLVAMEERYDRRTTKLENAFDVEQNRGRRLGDYVEDLRVHISEGKGPPPPDWPEGLR